MLVYKSQGYTRVLDSNPLELGWLMIQSHVATNLESLGPHASGD
jgi:hypothetical protein